MSERELERSLEDARQRFMADVWGDEWTKADEDQREHSFTDIVTSLYEYTQAVRADERAPWAEIARKQALTINYLQTVSKDVPDALKAMLARAETAEVALADERARLEAERRCWCGLPESAPDHNGQRVERRGSDGLGNILATAHPFEDGHDTYERARVLPDCARCQANPCHCEEGPLSWRDHALALEAAESDIEAHWRTWAEDEVRARVLGPAPTEPYDICTVCQGRVSATAVDNVIRHETEPTDGHRVQYARVIGGFTLSSNPPAVLGPAADQLRKALVEAAIPLEVLLADKRERGPIEKIASSTYEAIEQGVNAIRSALAASPVPGPAPHEGAEEAQ